MFQHVYAVKKLKKPSYTYISPFQRVRQNSENTGVVKRKWDKWKKSKLIAAHKALKVLHSVTDLKSIEQSKHIIANYLTYFLKRKKRTTQPS